MEQSLLSYQYTALVHTKLDSVTLPGLKLNYTDQASFEFAALCLCLPVEMQHSDNGSLHSKRLELELDRTAKVNSSLSSHFA